MTVRFDRFFEAVMVLEGYSEAHPSTVAKDGSITIWGLDIKAQPTHIAAAMAGGYIGRDEVRHITYTNYYLKVASVEELDERIAFVIFDMKFHGWSKKVYARVQQFLVDQGHAVEVDGLHGPECATSLIACSADQIDQLLRLLSATAKTDAIAKNATMSTRFGNVEQGIINRYTRRIEIAQGFSRNPGDVQIARVPPPGIQVTVRTRAAVPRTTA